MTLYFDMDGTIADLYSVDGWLDKLIAEDSSPYREAMPLCRLSTLARQLNRAQQLGLQLGIISWTSKESSESYHEAVQQAKLQWLKKHLPSVKWDKIHIVKYGEEKGQFAAPRDILFDDEEKNRATWPGQAFEPKDIMLILKELG